MHWMSIFLYIDFELQIFLEYILKYPQYLQYCPKSYQTLYYDSILIDLESFFHIDVQSNCSHNNFYRSFIILNFYHFILLYICLILYFVNLLLLVLCFNLIRNLVLFIQINQSYFFILYHSFLVSKIGFLKFIRQYFSKNHDLQLFLIDYILSLSISMLNEQNYSKMEHLTKYFDSAIHHLF